MSLILVAALSGALSSPVAAQGIPEPEFTEEKMWDEARRYCDEEEVETDRVRCRQFTTDLQKLSTQPAKGMAKRFMTIAKKNGGLCTDSDLQKYGLSHIDCEKHFARKTPVCEREYLSEPRPGAFNLILFVMCLLPERACNPYTTSDNQAWKEHCAELAMDGNG